MARYNKQISSRIIELIADGENTTTDVCKIVGIARKTFYRWKEAYPDFSKLILKAESERFESVKIQAEKALHRKLEGYVQQVRRTVYTPSKEDPKQLVIKQHVVTEKFCEPETRFLLQLRNGDKVTEKSNQKAEVEKSQLTVSVHEEKAKKDLNKLDDTCLASIVETTHSA